MNLGKVKYVATVALCFLIALIWSYRAEAGFFNDIKRKATKAASEVAHEVTETYSGKDSDTKTDSKNPGNNSSSQATAAGGPAPQASSGSRGKATPHPSGFPPELMFSTVLNGVQLHYKTGKLQLNQIQAVFLPDPPTKSKSIYAYDPTNSGGLIWAVLNDGAGNKQAKFEFTGQNIKGPFWLLNTARCSECEPGNRTNPLKPGKYTLDFYVEGEHFYHFPFSVDTVPPANPFDGGDLYFINGDWEKWGYLYYSEARPEQNLIWKVWLRNKENNIRGIDAKIDVTVYRDGKPLAKNPPATHNLKPSWNRFEFGLTEPMKGTSGGRYFKARDLLAQDGNYTLKMVINGDEYGTWPFSVNEGKLQYTGRSERGKADPLSFIEGGKDAWWYEMQ